MQRLQLSALVLARPALSVEELYAETFFQLRMCWETPDCVCMPPDRSGLNERSS